MSIAAVVLAAGASRRLGRPKQSVEIAGETLLARAVRVAREAGLQPVIVVMREGAEFASLLGEDVAVVLNPAADEGIASSIRCGVGAAARYDVRGAVVMTCDQPGVLPEHLRLLVDDDSAVTASAYAGRVGVPAYFPRSSFPTLLELYGDVGAREMLSEARPVASERLAIDVDTEEDVAIAKRAYEQRPVEH